MASATMQDTEQSETADDIFVPSSTWPIEAIQLYNKLDEETSNGEWEKQFKPSQEGKEQRDIIAATGDKMFSGAIFVSKSKRMAKGVITYGPWLQGIDGHVHGGAISTVHDHATGAIALPIIGPCVTANLNTRFLREIQLGATTLVTAEVDNISGRKCMLTSKITSPDENILYSEASVLYVSIKRESRL